MSKGVELESKIIDAIEYLLVEEEDIKEAKRYFHNLLVNDIIDECVEELI